MKFFLVACGFCLILITEAAVKSPFRQLPDEKDNDSLEEKQQTADIHGLKDNVTQLWQAVRDFRILLADHVDRHQVQNCHNSGGNQYQSGNLVNALVGGVQKPVIGVTETLTSDYFPFPENSHRPNEHYPNPIQTPHGGQSSHQVHHQGGHSQQARSGNPACGLPPHSAAFMRPPRFRSPQEYDFAVCHMLPNSALPASERGNVHGLVFFNQKKDSKTLYMGLRLSGFNTSLHADKTADLRQHEDISSHGQQKQPIDRFVQETIKTTGPLTQQLNQKQSEDFSKGHQHGFHVHEYGDLSGGCESAGGHYNPYRLRHGGPNSRIRHNGDFGNMFSDEEGSTNLIMTDDVASLRGQYSIIGKSLVIHADPDDLGLNPQDPRSGQTGNSGARLACCVIERVNAADYNEGAWAKRPGAPHAQRSGEPVGEPKQHHQEHHVESERFEQKHN